MATPAHVIAFRDKYRKAAEEAAAGTSVFPETILAAAGLESSYGRSKLAASYNNFFGIKADPSWKGKFIVMKTKEQRKDGSVYWEDAKFRHYDTARDSFANYVRFISGPRYRAAGVLTASTPEDQFKALQKAGYATDLRYAEKLTRVLNWYGGRVVNWVKSNPGATGMGIILAAAVFFF